MCNLKPNTSRQKSQVGKLAYFRLVTPQIPIVKGKEMTDSATTNKMTLVALVRSKSTLPSNLPSLPLASKPKLHY